MSQALLAFMLVGVLGITTNVRESGTICLCISMVVLLAKMEGTSVDMTVIALEIALSRALLRSDYIVSVLTVSKRKQYSGIFFLQKEY